jgi:spore coat protein CotH
MGRRTGGILLVAALFSAGCGDKNAGLSGHGLYPLNAQNGLSVFDENTLTTYSVTMDPADWDAMVANPLDNTWHRATLDWQGETWFDVAVRPAGQRSRVPGNPKPSFRFKFNYYVPHRKFHDRFLNGVKMVSDTLDPSMIRRRIEDGIYRSSGLPASRMVSARVNINGTYKGVYGVEERVKRPFIKDHFGADHLQQLYNYVQTPPTDVVWSGPDPTQYVPAMFVAKLTKLDPSQPLIKVSNPQVVCDFVNFVNNAPWATAAAQFDVDMFCRFMAAEVVTGETDGYDAVGGTGLGSRSSNFRIYPNPNKGKWIVLAWDREEGYWALRDSIVTGFDQRILTRQLLLQDPATLDQFKAVLGQLLAGPASVDAMNAQIDFLQNQLQAAVADDPYKTAGSVDGWLQHLQTIRTFVQQQNAIYQSQLP